MKTSWILAAVAALTFGAFWMWSQADEEPELTVLFVGNSYTETNDLPELVKKVAKANGTIIDVEAYTGGTLSIANHLADAELLQLIADEAYDIVVIQEQSELPALERSLHEESLPNIVELAEWAQAAGSEVILFETWAHAGGSGFSRHDSFEDMQADLTAAYRLMAAEAGATVAPVGQAWQEALLSIVGAPMHTSDGSHPTIEGSTLAAMVIAGTILETEIDSVPGGLVDGRAKDIFLEIVAFAPTLDSIG